MPSAVRLREDYSAEALRTLARRSKDVNQSRRLLSLAAVRDGMDRGSAAKIRGIDRQTLRPSRKHGAARRLDALVAVLNRGAGAPWIGLYESIVSSWESVGRQRLASRTSPEGGEAGVQPDANRLGDYPKRRMVDLAHLLAVKVTSSAVEAPPRGVLTPLSASITTSPGVRDVVPIHEWRSNRQWRPKWVEPLGKQ